MTDYRLQKELMVLMMSTEKGVSAFPDGENLFKWIGTISGPLDTVRRFLPFWSINTPTLCAKVAQSYYSQSILL